MRYDRVCKLIHSCRHISWLTHVHTQLGPCSRVRRNWRRQHRCGRRSRLPDSRSAMDGGAEIFRVQEVSQPTEAGHSRPEATSFPREDFVLLDTKSIHNTPSPKCISAVRGEGQERGLLNCSATTPLLMVTEKHSPPPPPLCRRYINVLFTLNPLPREVSFFLEVAQHSETLAGGSMRVSRYKQILAPAHPPTKQSPPRIVPRPHIARRPTTMIKDGSLPE